MENIDDSGGDGDRDSSFGNLGYPNFQNRNLFRLSPRLPLDRFLRAHYNQNQNQNQSRFCHQQQEVVTNVDVSPSPSCLAIGENRYLTSVITDATPWPVGHHQVVAFFDGTFVHGDKNAKESSGKKVKCRSLKNTPLIKGQWTEEEDRNLIRLVKQFGVRKWSQVAENIVGRAGKQCRERWQNHLRPDIKKDSWSEEEEKMLVEAHEELGNKWAEIAKRINGRTENSIKNHWNATKRRQNSRRKNKRVNNNNQESNNNNKKKKSTILQDYIQAKYPNKGCDNANASSTTTTTITVATTASEGPSIQTDGPGLSPSASYDSTSLLIQQHHDEDMSFMQSLFPSSSTMVNDGKASLHPFSVGRLNPELKPKPEPEPGSQNFPYYHGVMQNDNMEDRSNMGSNMYNNGEFTPPPPPPPPPQVNNHPSDCYLSYLLNWGVNGSSSSNNHSYGGSSSSTMMEFRMMNKNNQGSNSSSHSSLSSSSSGAKGKDIDLMELIFSSSQSSHGSDIN